MRPILTTAFVSISILISSLPNISIANESVRDVRRQVKEGSINVDNTCVDEYIDQANRQIWKTGLTPPIGAVSTSGLAFGGAMAGGGIAQLVGTVGWAALGFMGVGAFVGLCVGTTTLATLEAVAITKLVQTNFLIKVIAEARGDQEARKSFTKFLNKYDRKYPEDRVFSKVEEVTALLNRADSELKLCDGSLIQKKSGFLRKKNRKLASKNEIFNYIHQGLKL